MTTTETAYPASLFDLTGRTALVTGGGRGLGEFIAEAFVRSGVRTYISSRKADVCQATAQRLSEFGECVALPADLSDPEQITGLAGELRAREPELDILVNNAGATWGAPLEEFPMSGFDRVLDLNVKSPFRLTQALLPALREGARKRGSARVVNIGSVAGISVSSSENYSYTASKAAIHQLTRHLANRLATENITVNAIAPGPFHTKMMAFVLDDPEGKRRVESGIPLSRVGVAEDIAGAAMYLCSDAAAYVTGAIIPLDGGLTGAGGR